MSLGLPPNLKASIQRCLTESSGRAVEVLEASPMTGGCIHRSVRLSTDMGESFFLKWSPDPGEDDFLAEADGLEALAASGGPTVPEVIGYSPPAETPSWLLLEFVSHGRPAPDYWEALGQGLADLHGIRPEPYGWDRPNYIGSLPQANDVTDDWDVFWWTRRLLPPADAGARRKSSSRPPRRMGAPGVEAPEPPSCRHPRGVPPARRPLERQRLSWSVGRADPGGSSRLQGPRGGRSGHDRALRRLSGFILLRL